MQNIESIIFISIFICFCYFLVHIEFCEKNSDYENIKYNKEYIYLLNEAYSKTPDIENEIKIISSFHKNKSIPLFILLDSIRIYGKSIRITNITHNLKYNNGDIGSLYFQMKHYNQLISSYDKKNRIKTICEVGFQVGVGAITLITSVKHDVNYIGFDYGNNYSKDSFKLLSKYFSMKIVWGDSQRTIPFFYKSNNTFEKCDVIHIDARHDESFIYNDIINMKKISHPKSLLLLDDVCKKSKSVLKAKKEHSINSIKCFNKPYCIALYN